MKPLYHLVASSFLGIAILVITKSYPAALAAFLAGIFIDLDHLIDFWALESRKPFSIKDFLNAEKYDLQRKWVFIFLHSWELMAGLFIWDYFHHWPVILTAITASMTFHLLLDIYNLTDRKMHPLTYFLVFRIIKGFKKVPSPYVSLHR